MLHSPGKMIKNANNSTTHTHTHTQWIDERRKVTRNTLRRSGQRLPSKQTPQKNREKEKRELIPAGSSAPEFPSIIYFRVCLADIFVAGAITNSDNTNKRKTKLPKEKNLGDKWTVVMEIFSEQLPRCSCRAGFSWQKSLQKHPWHSQRILEKNPERVKQGRGGNPTEISAPSQCVYRANQVQTREEKKSKSLMSSKNPWENPVTERKRRKGVNAMDVWASTHWWPMTGIDRAAASASGAAAAAAGGGGASGGGGDGSGNVSGGAAPAVDRCVPRIPAE